MPNTSPTPQQVKQARERAGLSQKAAGALIYRHWRSWQNWENGTNRMDPAFWELFLLKTQYGPDKPPT